jgi:hypothetical protein
MSSARRMTLGAVPSNLLNTMPASGAGGGMGGPGPKTARASVAGPGRVASAASHAGAATHRTARASMAAPSSSSMMFGSFGGGAGAGAGALATGAARPSHGGRKSSFGGKVLTDDPRPMASAEFVREGVRTVITFLDEFGYSKIIPAKLLKGPPTTAEFEDIAMFIVRQLDPAFKFSAKASADLPDIFKTLRYVPRDAVQPRGFPVDGGG